MTFLDMSKALGELRPEERRAVRLGTLNPEERTAWGPRTRRTYFAGVGKLGKILKARGLVI